MLSLPVLRPEEMPDNYSINHILTWLSESCYNTPTKTPVSDLRLIYDDVSEIFGLQQDQLKGRTKKRDIIIPRHLTMYVASRKTSETLRSIGQFFNTDHSNVIHAIKSVSSCLDTKEQKFMNYWDSFRHYSRYYSSDLENTEKPAKRLIASMPIIKNDILAVLEISEKDFFYGDDKKTRIARYIFCYVSSIIGHKKNKITQFLRQNNGYATKYANILTNWFNQRNHRTLTMWELYITKSHIYHRIKTPHYDAKSSHMPILVKR